MDIIKRVDGGRATHKQNFTKVMNEFNALNSIEWIEKGWWLGESAQLNNFLPTGVCWTNYKGLETNMHDCENVDELLFAERWVHRLGVGMYPADLDPFDELV